MTRSAHGLAASLALAAALALAKDAAAQPTPADRALASALFEDGRALFAAGKTDEACAKLAQSYALEPALGTLLNLALCHEKQDKTATAWAELTTAADQASKAKEPDRLKFATAESKKLEARLSRLVVRAADVPAGASVRLDGREIGAAALGTAIPLDPGDHRVELSAPGKRAFATTVKLESGPVTQTLEVPPLADDGGAAPVQTSSASPQGTAPPSATPTALPSATITAPASATAAPTAPPSASASGRSVPRFAGGLAVGAAGLVGVVVGSYFGARTFDKKGAIGSHCHADGGCDDVGFELQKDAHDSATISTVSFAIGLAAVAAGAVLVITSGPSDKPKASAWIAPAAGGLQVVGAW